nr:hypothetical protein [Maliibacterium massiliense]
MRRSNRARWQMILCLSLVLLGLLVLGSMGVIARRPSWRMYVCALLLIAVSLLQLLGKHKSI